MDFFPRSTPYRYHYIIETNIYTPENGRGAAPAPRHMLLPPARDVCIHLIVTNY